MKKGLLLLGQLFIYVMAKSYRLQNIKFRVLKGLVIKLLKKYIEVPIELIAGEKNDNKDLT
jgi:hypothetical protein